MKELVYDIETNGLLRAQTAKDGTVIPKMTKFWLLIVGDPATGVVDAYSDVDPDLQPLAVGYKRLRGADRLIGHNVLNFDVPAMETFGFPMEWSKQIDTMILSRLKEPSRQGGHSLERWGELLKYPKGDFKAFDAYSKEMLDYALQDVRLNIVIWNQLKHLLVDMPEAVKVEHVFGWCMSLQMRNGFAFDLAAAEALQGDLRQEVIEAEHKLQDIFPPIVHQRFSEKTGKRLKDRIEVFNPGSRQQIARRLINKYQWKPGKFTSNGSPQVDEGVLAELPYPEAKEMAAYLQAEKKRGMLENWIKACVDGRVYGYINTIGANTHRCTHRDPNVAQADKDKRMRKLWKATAAMVMVGCDAEGLELRMMGHYLAVWDGGEFYNAVINGKKEDGTDVHSRNMKIAKFFIRDNAKTLIYALN